MQKNKSHTSTITLSDLSGGALSRGGHDSNIRKYRYFNLKYLFDTVTSVIYEREFLLLHKTLITL